MDGDAPNKVGEAATASVNNGTAVNNDEEKMPPPPAPPQSSNGNGSGLPPRKLRKVVTEDSDSDESLEMGIDEETKRTQKALEELDLKQSEIDAINERASEEILRVEQKYNKERKPIFDQRNESISNISNFWLTAMVNHPQLSLLITEEEEDCLHFLNKMEVEESEDIKSGYRIKFYFEKNPFFENDVLMKEFRLGTANPKSMSTEIKWKPGMDLTKKPKDSRSSADSRKREYDPKNFFYWFADHVDPSADDIAETIKDDLWPNPLQYYLVPDPEGMEGSGSEDDDESGGSEDEEDGMIVVEEEEEIDDDDDNNDDED